MKKFIFLILHFFLEHFQVIAPIFIGEIASPSIRGRLGTMFQVFVVLGIFLMYVIGNYYQWKTLAILCSAVPFFIILALSFLRDSPASYMLRGRPELARKAMVWLRNTADIDEEMYALQVRSCDQLSIVIVMNKIDICMSCKPETTDRPLQRSLEGARASGGTRYTVYNICCARDPTIRQPLLLCIFLMLNQQLSGVNAVIFYTVSIFQSSRITLDANEATIIVGAVLLIATIVSSYSVSHVNRRATLIGTQGRSHTISVELKNTNLSRISP